MRHEELDHASRCTCGHARPKLGCTVMGCLGMSFPTLLLHGNSPACRLQYPEMGVAASEQSNKPDQQRAENERIRWVGAALSA